MSKYYLYSIFTMLDLHMYLQTLCNNLENLVLVQNHNQGPRLNYYLGKGILRDKSYYYSLGFPTVERKCIFILYENQIHTFLDILIEELILILKQQVKNISGQIGDKKRQILWTEEACQ